MSEPAILVKRGISSQVWTMKKLEDKIVDMRELYEEHQRRGGTFNVSNYVIQGVRYKSLFQESNMIEPDPFFESQENHNLIGVANVFLEALFHEVSLDYHTPIISQQGEVAGRLQVT